MKRSTKRDMKKIKILVYSTGLVLSNIYLKAIIQCLESKFFNEIVDVLFNFIFFYRIKLFIKYLKF